MHEMSKRELRSIFLYSAVLALITSIPYLLGYASETDSWHFTGFVYGVDDGNSYIAKMLRGSEGDWLFRTPYSSMPQRGVLAFFPYLLLGKLAGGAAIHEQLVVLFHLFRVAMTPLAVYATYRLASIFLAERRWRCWATVLTTAGGSLGWVAVAFGKTSIHGSLPLDWYSPEWFGFLSFFGQPHLLLARSLLMLALSEYLLAEKDPRRAWMSGFFLLALCLVHPLSVVSGYAILVSHLIGIVIAACLWSSWLVARTWIISALKAGLVAFPLTTYYIFSFAADPFLSKWTEQNVIRSPHPMHLLIAYGLLLLPAILGLRNLVRERSLNGLLLLTWLVALPFLAYAPHNLQRRLPEGIFAAWAITAALGLSSHSVSKRARSYASGVLILALSLPTTLMILGGGTVYARQTGEPVFRPAEEVEVFDYLREEITSGSVVLSAYATGNAMPAWAPVKVVIGHGVESVFIAELEPQVRAFYAGEMDLEARQSFLATQNVEYVFFGPAEMADGHFDIGDYPELKPCFENGPYRVYQFMREE